jgi:hypothetical protein
LVHRVERLIEERKQSDVWIKPVRRHFVNIVALLGCAMLIGFAPRVALSYSTEQPSHTGSEFLESWLALHKDLLQLEAELECALTLPKDTACDTGAEPLLGQIRQRTVLLRAKSEEVLLSLRKESE